MPYLNIQTNQELGKEEQKNMLTDVSATVANALGKPESYVMVALQTGIPMTFAGETAPAAYLQLKSLGLQESQTAALSSTLCQWVEENLGVSSDRVYIEFSGPPRKMWGWQGGTF
ncbi:MAG: hypothetical protein D6698_04345 [Gammaproteobacteria bacterium]|nr:MAG: hypothetical protein D6698_04345 [Gammaproteobacteria bacterium]